MQTDPIERDMGAYYARRASVYERMYAKAERQADLRAIEALLPDRFAGRRVLEIACGTGWWTPQAARDAADWLATDLNPETMAVARHKHLPPCVRFQTVDAFGLEGLEAAAFDAAFAGFWWSHLSLAQLPQWLSLLHSRLAPGARVVMLDNIYVEGSSTPISRIDNGGNRYQLRPLDDGSTHEVLKNFPQQADVRRALQQAAELGGRQVADVQWHAFDHYWLIDYTLSDYALGDNSL